MAGRGDAKQKLNRKHEKKTGWAVEADSEPDAQRPSPCLGLQPSSKPHSQPPSNSASPSAFVSLRRIVGSETPEGQGRDADTRDRHAVQHALWSETCNAFLAGTAEERGQARSIPGVMEAGCAHGRSMYAMDGEERAPLGGTQGLRECFSRDRSACVAYDLTVPGPDAMHVNAFAEWNAEERTRARVERMRSERGA